MGRRLANLRGTARRASCAALAVFACVSVASAARPPSDAPLDVAAPPAPVAPVVSWRLLDAQAAPSPAISAAPLSSLSAGGARPTRVICVAASDCYAGAWPDRIAARAEQAAARAERVAPLSAFAAAPFALFSVAAIAWGLARGER
ncbi:hypothetical protein, partial [Rubrimonas sp.]|uniref:hypothetical protein n=1 Tax=Rubrimonas sp. TaxID=2036015 RepID=UPI002FDECD9C